MDAATTASRIGHPEVDMLVCNGEHLKPVCPSDDAASAASDGGPHGFNRRSYYVGTLTCGRRWWTLRGALIIAEQSAE